MKMSEKRRSALYDAIHAAIVDVRVELKLPGKDDYTLAQVINKIWAKQKGVLNLQ
jgi:hypothetical protein